MSEKFNVIHKQQFLADQNSTSKQLQKRYDNFETMNKKIEQIKMFRHFILSQINGLTGEQLNFIPAGYNNNIIWNTGHLVASLQGICYKRAGLEITIEDKYFTPFLTNTKPEKFIDSNEIEMIKALMISTIDTLQTDFAKKIFGHYTPSENIKRIYGIEVADIEDALDFLLYHEGLHSGYILALKHLV